MYFCQVAKLVFYLQYLHKSANFSRMEKAINRNLSVFSITLYLGKKMEE
jgi:hypothetical protein